VAAIPADERCFYSWRYEVVLAASGVSEEIATRIREHYGSPPDEHERMVTEQRVFRSWRIATADAPITVAFALGEVMIDTRCPRIDLERSYSAPTAAPTTG
jgi:hypothetical protein